MKVLIVGPDLKKIGGVSNFLETIRGHFDVTTEYFTIGTRVGTNSHVVVYVLSYLMNYLKFLQKVIVQDFDVVHINPSLKPVPVVTEGMFILLAKVAKKKVLIFFHGWNSHFETTLKGMRLWLFKKTYFRSDLIVVLAERFKKSFVNWGYNRCVVGKTAFNEALLRQVAEKNQSEYNVLVMSRIEREKGVFEMIDALQILHGRGHAATLHIAGVGGALEELKAMAKRNDIRNVLFYGFVTSEEKATLLRKCHILVLPTSHGEGQPVAIFEAMAMGLAVLVTPVGGIVDFFEDGKMGTYLASKDPLVIADKLEYYLKNRNALNSIYLYNSHFSRNHYSSSAVAQQIQKLYYNLCEES
ncbi:MAG: glycosyltransferase family 4 protein [Chitinivibrionales bacterium]|nr:glycosyltransferase family 4 protein [Chitinivibrionales bacterium]